MKSTRLTAVRPVACSDRRLHQPNSKLVSHQPGLRGMAERLHTRHLTTAPLECRPHHCDIPKEEHAVRALVAPRDVCLTPVSFDTVALLPKTRRPSNKIGGRPAQCWPLLTDKWGIFQRLMEGTGRAIYICINHILKLFSPHSPISQPVEQFGGASSNPAAMKSVPGAGRCEHAVCCAPSRCTAVEFPNYCNLMESWNGHHL
jgi:hypothetical protein